MPLDDIRLQARVRTMQILAAALTAGTLPFWGIVILLAYGPNAAPAPAHPAGFISLLAVGFLVVAGALSFIVPGVIARNGVEALARGRGRESDLQLLDIKQTTLLTGLALLEGPAFLGLIAFHVERQPLVLLVPALAIIAMALRFPTNDSVRGWLEAGQRRIMEIRTR